MENPSLKPAIKIFENLFSKLNDEFFSGSLIPPVIVISPEGKASANGWCTSWKAWKSTGKDRITHSVDEHEFSKSAIKRDRDESDVTAGNADDEGYYEISLSAEYLSNGTDEIIGTLLHEMIHLYNLQNGIKDTSRSGYYHNKSFRDSAEAHGLVAEKVEGSGYSKTSLSESAVEFVKKQDKVRFDLFRTADTRETEKSPKSAVHRYVCPCCGNIVRATKLVRVGCLDCKKEMIEQMDELKELRDVFLHDEDSGSSECGVKKRE